MHTLEELKKLWEEFGNIPVNEDDEIEEYFHIFPVGTPKLDVWLWFDGELPNGIVQDFGLCG